MGFIPAEIGFGVQMLNIDRYNYLKFQRRFQLFLQDLSIKLRKLL